MPQRISYHKPPHATPQATQRDYDRTRRDQHSKRFYNSAAWKQVRRTKLSMSPLCELCLQQTPRQLRPASHVHHKIELRDDKSLGLDLDNLQALCHGCHSRLHASQPRPPGGG